MSRFKVKWNYFDGERHMFIFGEIQTSGCDRDDFRFYTISHSISLCYHKNQRVAFDVFYKVLCCLSTRWIERKRKIKFRHLLLRKYLFNKCFEVFPEVIEDFIINYVFYAFLNLFAGDEGGESK